MAAKIEKKKVPKKKAGAAPKLGGGTALPGLGMPGVDMLDVIVGSWRVEKGCPMSRSRIQCGNGATMSVQANEFTYCHPRTNMGPWESVEVGFPSEEMPELMPWAEDPADPTGTVYGRVPVAVVAGAIAARGGRVDSPLDWRCRAIGMEGGQVAKPLDFESAGCVDFSDKGEAMAACLRWFQAAALGSPDEERSARFEAALGEGEADWGQCMACLQIGAGRCSNNGDDGAEAMAAAWVAAVAERLELEAAAQPGKKSKRKTGL